MIKPNPGFKFENKNSSEDYRDSQNDPMKFSLQPRCFKDKLMASITGLKAQVADRKEKGLKGLSMPKLPSKSDGSPYFLQV